MPCDPDVPVDDAEQAATDGTISRVAVQRSDFRSLLMSGGVPALTAELSRKTANLTGNVGKAPDGVSGSRG